MISTIYTVNQTNATVTAPEDGYAIIPFGSVIRRKGRGIMMDGGSLIGNGSGYYKFLGDLEYIPEAVGNVSVQLYQDGVPIPGTLKTTYAATANNPIHIPVIGVARLMGNCCANTVFAIGVNASGIISNLSTIGTKLD